MGRPTSFLGNTGYEIILPMTNDLTIADAATNLVVGTSGLSGGKTLTLPSIQQMLSSQNMELRVINLTASGGTITVAANAADNIVGRVTCAVSTGLVLKHDGRNRWFGF